MQMQQYESSNGGRIKRSPAPISGSQIGLKDFFSFISQVPDAQNMVLLIYPGDYCQPKALMSIYQKIDIFQIQFKLYITHISLCDNKQTIMVGFDSSYLNLTDQNTKATYNHLILLYLIKRMKTIKFVLCFDRQAIIQQSFTIIKKTFNYMASFLQTKDIEKYKNSFMVLISHQGRQQRIVETCKLQMQKSIREEGFYAPLCQFVNKIIQRIISQQRIFEFPSQMSPEKMQVKKKMFEQMIQEVHSYQNNQQGQQLRINDKYMIILQQKTAQWKLFSLGNKLQKIQKKGITKVFEIWDQFFQKFINFISIKIKKGSNPYSFINDNQAFILTKPSSKYEINIVPEIDKKVNQNGQTCQSYKLTRLFADLLEFFTKNYQKSQKLKNNQSNSNKVKLKKKLIKVQFVKFLTIFYQCGVLNSKTDEKIIYDYFMVFHQLCDMWSVVQAPKVNQGWAAFFFEESKIMDECLSNNTFFSKKLMPVLQNIFMAQLKMDLKKVKNGQYRTIQVLEQPVSKIKSLLNHKVGKLFADQRLTKIISQFQLQLCRIKLNKLSGKPVQKLQYLIQLTINSIQMPQVSQYLKILGQSLFQYLKRCNVKQNQVEIKQILIKLLQLYPLRNMNEMFSIYKEQFDLIIRKYKTKREELSQKQKHIICSYVQFLIKLGYIQKARESAYQMVVLDEQLSKKLIYKCSMTKQNSRLNIQFIRDVNQSKTGQFKKGNEQHILKVVRQLKDYLFIQNKNQTQKHRKQEDQLIDI